LLRQVLNELHEIDSNRAADRRSFNDISEKLLKDLQCVVNVGEFYTPAGAHSSRRDGLG